MGLINHKTDSTFIKAEPEFAKFLQDVQTISDAEFLISYHETSDKRTQLEQYEINQAKNGLQNTLSKILKKNSDFMPLIEADNINPTKEYKKLTKAIFKVISKIDQTEYTNAINSAKHVFSGLVNTSNIDVDQPERFPQKLDDFKKEFIKTALGKEMNLDIESANKKMNFGGIVKIIIKSNLQQIRANPKEGLIQLGKDLRNGINLILGR